MKFRYPIITLIGLIIIEMIIASIEPYPKWGDTSSGIIFLLILVCLSLITYLILRNVFRAIRGTSTKTPQNNVTPRRKQDTTPPWEE